MHTNSPRPAWTHSSAVACVSLLFASLAWAGNVVLGRAGSTTYSPVALTFWRWLVAALCMLPLLPRNVESYKRIAAQWRFMLAASVFGTLLFHSAQYAALQTTSAVTVSIMVCFSPIVVALTSVLMGHERLGGMAWLGIGVSLIGVLIVTVGGQGVDPSGWHADVGGGWMLCAIVSWAAYSTLLKRRPLDVSPGHLMAAMSVCAAMLLLPIYLWQCRHGGTVPPLPWRDVRLGMYALYMGLVASVLAYLAYNHGVARIGASRGSQFLHFMPLFVALLSRAFLDEALHVQHFLGFAFVLAGVWLAQGQWQTVHLWFEAAFSWGFHRAVAVVANASIGRKR